MRVFKKPIDQLNVSDETREIVRRSMFVSGAALRQAGDLHLHATPRELPGGERVRQKPRPAARQPAGAPGEGHRRALANREALAVTEGGAGLPTAVDNMSPRNPFIKTLSIIPIDPGVAAHSIIPVKGTGPVETGDDGVVKYESAHIDGVKSELVVRWEHSVQGQFPRPSWRCGGSCSSTPAAK